MHVPSSGEVETVDGSSDDDVEVDSSTVGVPVVKDDDPLIFVFQNAVRSGLPVPVLLSLRTGLGIRGTLACLLL
jgi:hypothetical protein